MNVIESYNAAIASGEFIADSSQASAAQQLQNVYDALLIARSNKPRKFFFPWLRTSPKPIHGLYLWGSVGAGKTWLMDLFYDNLPTPRKLRLHFHRFMQQIQQRLAALQGTANPLQEIAKEFAAKTDILCFDEFIVHDITDAMILANLLHALFDEGITLVATSNTPPDNLYRNGLQRARFLPAIALLKQHTDVIHVQSNQDYRLRVLTEAGIYFYPLNKNTDELIKNTFNHYTHGRAVWNEDLIISGRAIPTIAISNQIIWFDFKDLCHIPRSQNDYLEISQNYHTVFLSNVIQIKPEQDDIILYLINLVDVFYDTKVKLIISAAVPIAELYQAGRYLTEFQRTKSRLMEMQSLEYLQLPHLG